MFKSIILAFTFFLGAIYGAFFYFFISILDWFYSTFIELHKDAKKALYEGIEYVFDKMLE